MIAAPEDLIGDFLQVAALACIELSRADIEHSYQHAPHSPSSMPTGKGAVYIFSLPVPSTIVLKVGKVSTLSNARFQYQHYSPKSSRSNLARSILSRPAEWPNLNINALDASTVGAWIRQHTDRDNFYFASDKLAALALFEVFLHCRLRPIFEG